MYTTGIRAGRPFLVEPVRTSDAIHLATIAVLGVPPAMITVLSRDQRVRENVIASGSVVHSGRGVASFISDTAVISPTALAM